jgi:hypothetical protein
VAGTQPDRNLPLICPRHAHGVTTATVDRGTRRRRRLRLARTLAGASVRTVLAPASTSRRPRVGLRSAAETLTALGIRVAVIPPPTPWPRAGRRVVADRTGWLADLAVVTAVLAGSSAPAPEVVCPVAVRFRTAAGYLDDAGIPRTVADVVATSGLVIEVHCLPGVM